MADGQGDGEFAAFKRRFWNKICDYQDYLKLAVGVSGFLVGMLLLALPGIRRGSASYVILVVDLVLLVPLVVVTGYLVYRCRHREPDRRFD
jgi:hypothetical protein